MFLPPSSLPTPPPNTSTCSSISYVSFPILSLSHCLLKNNTQQKEAQATNRLHRRGNKPPRPSLLSHHQEPSVVTWRGALLPPAELQTDVKQDLPPKPLHCQHSPSRCYPSWGQPCQNLHQRTYWASEGKNSLSPAIWGGFRDAAGTGHIGSATCLAFSRGDSFVLLTSVPGCSAQGLLKNW